MSKRPWLCPLLSLAIAVGIALLFGVSFWTIFLILVFLACPITMIWAYLIGERPLPVPLDPAPATRGMTLNWIAPWYDSLWCPAFGLGRRYRGRTMMLAAVQRGDHVLDVGCGTGWLTRRAADIAGPTGAASGIDAAPDMIRMAMQQATRERNAALFKVAMIEALPFQDSSFDLVVASLIIHHLPPDLKVVGLKEIYRVLKPGGRLFLAEPDRPNHRFWRIIFCPISLHPNLRDHLQGRMPDLLRNAGFVSLAPLGHWHQLLTFWSALKPAS